MTEDSVPSGKLQEKNMMVFFASLKLQKKGVRSGFISLRYGSADPDPQH
jgi:hypothetical protein